MKKTYEKPKVEVELFSLSQNIAACSEKVLFGPDQTEACGTYFPADPFALENSVQSNAVRVPPFYDNDSCKCYYTAPRESGYFSS